MIDASTSLCREFTNAQFSTSLRLVSFFRRRRSWTIPGRPALPSVGILTGAHRSAWDMSRRPTSTSIPGLLLPMVALGGLVGLVYWYFRTRPAPAVLCEAFAVGCLFNAFAFEGNIDKQLGGFITAFLVMMLVMRLA